MENCKEKYYRGGRDVEDDLGLPPLPRDYFEPPAYEPKQRPGAPRVERFVIWCIDHQIGVSVVLWGLILAAGAALWFSW